MKQHSNNNLNKGKEEQKSNNSSQVVKKPSDKPQDQGFRPHFPHWCIEDIKEGLSMKEVFYGTFQIIEKRFAIICPYFQDKIWIHEYKTNRALHGSTVAFKFLADKADEKKEEKKDKTEEDEIVIVEVMKNRTIKNTFEGQNEFYFCDQNEINELNLKYRGQKLQGEVVGALKEPLKQEELLGQLTFKKIEHNTKDQKIDQIHKDYKIYFNSYKKQVQFEVVQSGDLFIQLGQQLESKDSEDLISTINNYNYCGEYLRWGRHSQYPFMRLLSVINKGKNIDDFYEVQKRLLKWYPIYIYKSNYEEYDVNQYNIQLDDQGKYVITPEDMKDRQDLSKQLTFTVDGPNSTDLDDALSIQKQEDKTYLIGVHISDVEHFVNSGSLLDLEANRRSTTLYLTHKRIQMLPSILSDICSLQPFIDKLTFSVLFYLDHEGELLSTKPITVVKSLIRSCARLTYQDATKIIEGQITSPDQLSTFSRICPLVDYHELFSNVCQLSQLSTKLREIRLTKGFLNLDRINKSVSVNEIGQLQLDEPEQRSLSGNMVEECMLLTNNLVARIIVEHNQKLAILIQQSAFQKQSQDHVTRMLVGFQLEHMVKQFDVRTSGTINQFIQLLTEIEQKDQNQRNQAIKELFIFKVRRNLQASNLTIVGSQDLKECAHFSLNMNYYTNFTSPIRRYQDILVHRLLAATINPNIQLDQVELQTKLNLNNEGKKVAKNITNEISKYYLYQYLQENPTFTDGFILEVNTALLTIVVPELDLEYKKFRNEMTGVTTFFEHGKQELKINFPGSEHKIILKALMKIQLRITANNDRLPKNIQMEIIFKIPPIKGSEEIIVYV